MGLQGSEVTLQGKNGVKRKRGFGGAKAPEEKLVIKVTGRRNRKVNTKVSREGEAKRLNDQKHESLILAQDERWRRA